MGSALLGIVALLDEEQRFTAPELWAVAFVGLAMFAAPGCVIAGAVGAFCRSPLVRIVAGGAGGLVPAMVFTYDFWTYEDIARDWPDWPYNILILVGMPLAAAITAGAFAARYGIPARGPD